MTPEELLKIFGIDVRFVDGQDSRQIAQIYPQDFEPLGKVQFPYASLARSKLTGQVLVLAINCQGRSHDVLHEGLHALCGPASFGDEIGLWHLQWILLPKLHSDHRYFLLQEMRNRYLFPEGELPKGDIGRVNRMLRRRMEHPRYLDGALKRNYISDNKTILLQGTHKDWFSHLDPWISSPDPWD